MSFLDERPELWHLIQEIILAAPDIDAQVFKRDIAPQLASSGCSTTLYASSNDKALLASRAVHGSPRAGDIWDEVVIADGVETIDVSNVDSDFVGHSYFGDNRSILSDVYTLFQAGIRADGRFGLEKVGTSLGSYWRLRS
jgi:esterase/lipase superfamily enzyme